MVIVSIKFVNKRIAILTLDDDYEFPLYKELIDNYGFSVDKVIDDDMLSIIINKHVKSIARGYVIDSLARSAKTKAKLVEGLHNKKIPPEVIDCVVCEYEDLGYINDYEYAKNYYELKSSSKSLRYIQNMLRSKGVSDDIINEVMSDVDYTNEIKQIEKFLDTKLKGNKNITSAEKNKIIASLFRKGYKTSNIYLTISQYLA